MPALFQPVMACQQLLQRLLPLIGLDFGQETETAQLDADHGHMETCAQACGAQHGAVAAEGDEQVEFLHMSADFLFFPGRKERRLAALALNLEGNLFRQRQRLWLLGVVQNADAAWNWVIGCVI